MIPSCGLCPRWVKAGTPHCVRCGGRVEAARAQILATLIARHAAQLFAEAQASAPAAPQSAVSAPPPPAKKGDVAAGGTDGLKAAALLRSARDQVTATLAAPVTRKVLSPSPTVKAAVRASGERWICAATRPPSMRTAAGSCQAMPPRSPQRGISAGRVPMRDMVRAPYRVVRPISSALVHGAP